MSVLKVRNKETNEWVKVGIPSGGIDLESAEVGQTIVVKAVDENGKPTEWEAADLSFSGYEFINKVTLTEDAITVLVSTDSNGDSFSCKEMVIRGTTTAADGTTTDMRIKFNTTSTSDAHLDGSNGFVKNDGCKWIMDIRTVAERQLIYYAGNNGGISNLAPKITYERNQPNGGFNEIASVIFITGSGGGFKAGSWFELWGR